MEMNEICGDELLLLGKPPKGIVLKREERGTFIHGKSSKI